MNFQICRTHVHFIPDDGFYKAVQRESCDASRDSTMDPSRPKGLARRPAEVTKFLTTWILTGVSSRVQGSKTANTSEENKHRQGDMASYIHDLARLG